LVREKDNYMQSKAKEIFKKSLLSINEAIIKWKTQTKKNRKIFDSKSNNYLDKHVSNL
jgi:hypothetical protein